MKFEVRLKKDDTHIYTCPQRQTRAMQLRLKNSGFQDPPFLFKPRPLLVSRQGFVQQIKIQIQTVPCCVKSLLSSTTCARRIVKGNATVRLSFPFYPSPQNRSVRNKSGEGLNSISLSETFLYNFLRHRVIIRVLSADKPV